MSYHWLNVIIINPKRLIIEVGRIMVMSMIIGISTVSSKRGVRMSSSMMIRITVMISSFMRPISPIASLSGRMVIDRSRFHAIARVSRFIL